MKKLVPDASKCTGCRVCEETCATAFYKKKDRLFSAIRIEPGENDGFDIAVCDQCGVCQQMCQIMAISTATNGVVRLDKKTCVGCLVCVGECLRNYMFYNDELPAPIKCSACGLCAKSCPAGALRIEETNHV
ncbi:MAG: 4Fe-4S binding protein [Oscillospiraceae bacterium]|nr:4Fe-4S binding protein [Oscillospiraceae bacterium]